MIELRGLVPEDGTWLGLNLAATQLTAACADREGFLATRGVCEPYVKYRMYSTFGNLEKWDAFVLDMKRTQTKSTLKLFFT